MRQLSYQRRQLMPDVYLKSPFRPNPKNPGAFAGADDIDVTTVSDTRVRSAIEVVANYVSLIPEINVTFEADVMQLKTQRYGAVNDVGLEAELQNELDTVAKNIETNLKDEEFKKVKVEPICVDVTPMGWGSGINGLGRTVLYIAIGTYNLRAEI